MTILERQVQFALLENQTILESVVGFVPSLVAAYLDIAAWGFSGQIDFVLADPSQRKYVTELEMVVSSQSKVEHVVEQVIRYNEAARVIYSSYYTILILLAAESPKKWRQQIASRLNSVKINHKIKEYELTQLEQVYLETLERNEAIFGLPHDEIRRSSVASLAQLNEIFAQFKQLDTDHMSTDDLFDRVTWRTRGSYLLRLHYAQYLGLIDIDDHGTVRLTFSGRRFRNYTNFPYRELRQNGRYFDLSEPQKRILRQNILSELRTSTQLNRLVMQIVTFLQYLVLIRGKFIPRNLNEELPEGAIAMFRELTQKRQSLTPRSIVDMIYWNSLYCRNLGLISIVDDGPFNRALFTEEGTRLYRLISDLINIRREESKMAML